MNFSKKWDELKDIEREVYKVNFPTPKEWKSFYE
jgi:hypothetical protein